MTIKKNRQKKKLKKKETERIHVSNMKQFLEEKWLKKVSYSCEHCLEIAYLSEMNDTTGYVTDEELILLSNNKLKYM
jgi:hypothetical protein